MKASYCAHNFVFKNSYQCSAFLAAAANYTFLAAAADYGAVAAEAVQRSSSGGKSSSAWLCSKNQRTSLRSWHASARGCS